MVAIWVDAAEARTGFNPLGEADQISMISLKQSLLLKSEGSRGKASRRAALSKDFFNNDR